MIEYRLFNKYFCLLETHGLEDNEVMSSLKITLPHCI